MTSTIGVARPDEIDAVGTLLAGHHLPLDGLSDHVATLLVARDASVLTSVEFTSACPSTAIVMRKAL